MVCLRFYRAQGEGSFTHHDEEGFRAKGRYFMNHDQWLNKAKIERHLDCRDRSDEPTPFISVYDNLADAEKRAEVLKEKLGNKKVFIAEIVVPEPRPSTLLIEFSDHKVLLPVLQHRNTAEGYTSFISTNDVRRHLDVSVAVSYKSEWFALKQIPRSIIKAEWPA